MRCAEVPWVKFSGDDRPWVQRVVADRFGGAHAFLDVARFEHGPQSGLAAHTPA